MGLLSGLGELGLGKMEGAKLYEDTKQAKPEAKKEEKPAEKPFDENDWLFDKSCECVMCHEKFTYRAVRTGKARLIGTDPDLRPRYDKIDPLKYDVICCPRCGYSAITKYYTGITAGQAKLVKEAVTGKVHGLNNSGVLSYDDAFKRYQVALVCSIAKKGKTSEKAYTALKMAWCLRGKKETYPVDAPNYEEVMKECRDNEQEALKAAYDGFIQARSEENFPIAGMDTSTYDYLLAELAYRFNEYDTAGRFISGILTSSSANPRIKDKARDLKDRIVETKKMMQQ